MTTSTSPGDADALLDEIEEFVTGTHGTHDSERVLATVMFTDIVGSTEHAARLGDRRWHELIADHDRLLRRPGSPSTAGRTIRTPATACSPLSTARLGRSAAHVSVVDAGPRPRASICVPACTPESASSPETTSPASPSTSAPDRRPRRPNRLVSGRCATRRRLNIAFRSAACESLQGVPGEWRLFVIGAGSSRGGAPGTAAARGVVTRQRGAMARFDHAPGLRRGPNAGGAPRRGARRRVAPRRPVTGGPAPRLARARSRRRRHRPGPCRRARTGPRGSPAPAGRRAASGSRA